MRLPPDQIGNIMHSSKHTDGHVHSVHLAAVSSCTSFETHRRNTKHAADPGLDSMVKQSKKRESVYCRSLCSPKLDEQYGSHVTRWANRGHNKYMTLWTLNVADYIFWLPFGWPYIIGTPVVMNHLWHQRHKMYRTKLQIHHSRSGLLLLTHSCYTVWKLKYLQQSFTCLQMSLALGNSGYTRTQKVKLN